MYQDYGEEINKQRAAMIARDKALSAEISRRDAGAGALFSLIAFAAAVYLTVVLKNGYIGSAVLFALGTMAEKGYRSLSDWYGQSLEDLTKKKFFFGVGLTIMAFIGVIFTVLVWDIELVQASLFVLGFGYNFGWAVFRLGTNS